MNVPYEDLSPAEQEILGRLKAHSVFLAKCLELSLLPQSGSSTSIHRRLKTLKAHLNGIAHNPESLIGNTDAILYRQFFVNEIKTFSAAIPEVLNSDNT